MIRIGIDLGGTKTEIIAVDELGNTLLRRRIDTVTDYAATLKNIVMLVQEVEAEFGESGVVGIGTPGSISALTNQIKNANSVWLNGRPIHEDLAKLLRRPVRVNNDANCFALSEAIDGAAQNYNVVFGVILGTGVGAGIIINGNILTGKNGIAGEWGHNSLPWASDDERPGMQCYCGKHGCIETFLSGPGMVRDHELHTRNKLSTQTLVSLAASGDVSCEATLRRYENRLARSLAHVINVLDPDVIVLGGGMSNVDRLYENVPKILPDYVFSDSIETLLIKNKHGDSSGVRGAAWLAATDLTNRH